jgi:hypothetical protein
MVRVRAPDELVRAVRSGGPEIEVSGTLGGLPALTLGPGTRLRGGVLEFEAGGIQVSRPLAVREIDGDLT